MLSILRRILRYRSLLATLTQRELKARYRGSVLGFLWSFVNPLLLLGVYTFVFDLVFGGGRVADGSAIRPYALFLVTGLFPWVWASSSLLEGTLSLTANSGLIRKAVFPAELLPLVSVLSNGAHFLLAMPILALALGGGRLMGYPIGGAASVLMPVVVLLQLPLVAGLALGLSALNVHFKDVRDIVANLLTLLFFMTPILYPLDAIPQAALRAAVRLNPFTPFTLAYQEVLFFGRWPGWELWLQMISVSAVAFWIGAWLFERLRETLVEAV